MIISSATNPKPPKWPNVPPVGTAKQLTHQPPVQSPTAPDPYGQHQTPAAGWGKPNLQTMPFLRNYTPQAQQQAFNTPTNFWQSGPNEGGGYWAPGGSGSPHTGSQQYNPGAQQGGAMFGRPHLAMMQGLGGPAMSTARHELGHMYDSRNGITAPTGGTRVDEHIPLNVSPFAWQAMNEHPTGNWDRAGQGNDGYGGGPVGTVSQWGNEAELYAGMNQDPQSIPQDMRKYFPQFAPSNYQPGPYQPKNTGRPEINQQAAPDWGTPNPPHADQRTLLPSPNENFQGQHWKDYWQHQYPGIHQNPDAGRHWASHENNPTHPPHEAPPGSHWSWEYANDGDPGNYWILKPNGGPS